jgi:DNA-binding winged helix-turn-helix (wHTH) protein/tetratricopeptide (TPR) repeat protein
LKNGIATRSKSQGIELARSADPDFFYIEWSDFASGVIMVKAANRHFNFGELVLDETCLFARRGEQTIQFTRNERALLLAFTQNPRRLMTRSRLLDEIAAVDSESSDRNIDFLVNRLRTKLGDSARAPKYIATQYGEGYVWVATQPTEAPLHGFLAIGLAHSSPEQSGGEAATTLLPRLRDQIAAELDPGQEVIALQHLPRAGFERVRYVLQISFATQDAAANCSASLRETSSKRIVKAFRLDLDPANDKTLTLEIERVAKGVVDALRQLLVEASTGLGAPADEALDVRLRRASTLLSSSNPAWLQKGEFLSQERLRDPSDADIALQWCLHLFARMVTENPFKSMEVVDRNNLETEIETTVLEFLPVIEASPLLMLAAAKLLFFINRGHLDLAEDIAERAFVRTADFAAALPVIGQLRQARGNYGEAIAFFDRGIDMADPDSGFLLHMQVLKCIALLAAGDSAGLQAAATFSYSSPYSIPEISLALNLMLTPVDQDLSTDVSKALQAAGPHGASRAIEYAFHTSARQMTSQGARANILGRLIGHARRQHGRGIVPDIVLRNTGSVFTES